MLSILTSDIHASPHNEGDLFKRIEVFGAVFDIFYGYYEEYERSNPDIEPMPIYPDFLSRPIFTNDGYPFVTKMQDGCRHYNGKLSKSPECAECKYYRQGKDLIGICSLETNKLSREEEKK